jgi:molybdopterin converting factor small subunit
MRVNLKSNYLLLGSVNIDSIDLDVPSLTLKELVEIISKRSTTSESLEYLNNEGTQLQPLFEVHVNGRILDLCEGVDTVLKDGDTVDFYLEPQYGG